MHPIGKVLSGIGGIILILCTILFAFGVNDVSEKSKDVNYVISGENSGNVDVYDTDFMGDIGFTIFVQGTYEDANGDGIWDVCEGANITAIHDGRYMENFGTNESYSVNASDADRFYFEVGGEYSECDSNRVGESRVVGGEELVKIGRACWGCMEGTMTIQSNEPVWVVYDDVEIAELVGGFLAAMSSACLLPCGCCILVVGLIVGFTMNGGNSAPAVTVAASASVMGQEMIEPQIPMPTDDSDPAHVYYGLMIARGFEPDLAEKMTRDQYPGFNQ